MTQASETETRFARLEALTMELAAANLRHDSRMDRIEAALERIGEKQEAINTQQEINTQAIAGLTASIVELRNMVADDIQRRSQ